MVVSAPFPLHWPPEPGGHGTPLVRYAYAMRLRVGLADGAVVAAPWARSTEAVNGTMAVTLLQAGLHSIGIQGVRPLGPAESTLIAREKEAETLLRAGKTDPLVRAITCGWIMRNVVVAAAITPLHPGVQAVAGLWERRRPAADEAAMNRRTSILGAAAVLAALLVAGTGWILLAGPHTPPEAEGEAWLSDFADLLTSPRALGARGPAALALFPGLGTWQPGACVTEWSRTDRSAPIVIYQRLGAGPAAGRRLRPGAVRHAQHHLTCLGRNHAGRLDRAVHRPLRPARVPPRRLPAQRAELQMAGRGGHVCKPGEPVGPGRSDAFSLLFVRYYGASTALPTPAEAERWMDATAALVASSDLPRASAAEAIRQAGVEMAPGLRDADGCPEGYDAPLDRHGPIGSHQGLWFEREAGQPCGAARFQAFHEEVWKREPVTADALVKRIAARLGQPVVSRSPDRDGLSYRWTTPYGTTVDLFEGLSSGMEHTIRLLVRRT